MWTFIWDLTRRKSEGRRRGREVKRGWTWYVERTSSFFLWTSQVFHERSLKFDSFPSVHLNLPLQTFMTTPVSTDNLYRFQNTKGVMFPWHYILHVPKRRMRFCLQNKAQLRKVISWYPADPRVDKKPNNLITICFDVPRMMFFMKRSKLDMFSLNATLLKFQEIQDIFFFLFIEDLFQFAWNLSWIYSTC